MAESLKPFEYQEKAIAALIRRKRNILADEAGVGKTMELILACIRNPEITNILVLCGRKVVADVWDNELEKWGDESCIWHIMDRDNVRFSHARGSKSIPKQKEVQFRAEIAALIAQTGKNFLITNFGNAEICLDQYTWDCIIIDEYHVTGLMNSKNRAQVNKGAKFWQICRKYVPKIPYQYFVTATPVTKGPHDFWAVLYLMHKTRFRGYWNFVEEHCTMYATWHSQFNIARRPKDVKKFKNFIRKYMIRRKLTQVRKDLPEMLIDYLGVPMTKRQEELYEEMMQDLLTQFVVNDAKEILVAPNEVVKYLRARQILCTPRIFGEAEDGGTLEALIGLVTTELENKNKVAIFAPFVKGLQAVEDALVVAFANHELMPLIFKVQGGMGAGEAQKTANQFTEQGGVFLGTIQSAMSYSIPDVDVEYFLGVDWSYINNYQAQRRGYRTNRKKPLRVRYLYHKNTLDKRVLEHYVQTEAEVDKFILTLRDLRGT